MGNQMAHIVTSGRLKEKNREYHTVDIKPFHYTTRIKTLDFYYCHNRSHQTYFQESEVQIIPKTDLTKIIFRNQMDTEIDHTTTFVVWGVDGFALGFSAADRAGAGFTHIYAVR